MEIGLISQKKNYLKKVLSHFIYLGTDGQGLGLSKDVLKIMAHWYANRLGDKVKRKEIAHLGQASIGKTLKPK